MLDETLLARIDGKALPVAKLLNPIRVATHLGLGTLRYITSDGYAGVTLDSDWNQHRIDEVPLDLVEVLS